MLFLSDGIGLKIEIIFQALWQVNKDEYWAKDE
jgi:hypothetical protein